MNLREENVNQFLDEDFKSYDSNISIIDNSDDDPNIHPPGISKKGSIRNSPDVLNYDPSSLNALLHPIQSLSDDECLTEVSTSSDEVKKMTMILNGLMTTKLFLLLNLIRTPPELKSIY